MTENRERGRRGAEVRDRRTAVRSASSRRRQKQRAKDSTVAFAVICAVMLCMTLVVFAIWSTGKANEAPFQHTTETPIRQESSSEYEQPVVPAVTDPQQPVQSGESGFQQLSDPFLVLVNDDVPLPENWQVTPAFIGEETVDQRIYQPLSEMINAAAADDIWLWVASGYRSVEDQEGVLSREIREHMTNDGMTEDEAREYSLRTIARPGHSEHHTGFVVDLNDVSDNFEDTEPYRWLSEHAAEYGFVQRYRADKVEYTGIDNESWHYRYVGKEHAQAMEQLDMCLEEYVQYLKGQGVQ